MAWLHLPAGWPLPEAAPVPACATLTVAEARRLGSHVFVCDYEAGRLVHEEVLSAGDLEVIFGPLHAQQAQTERRPLRRRPLRRRRREDFMGETIYKVSGQGSKAGRKWVQCGQRCAGAWGRRSTRWEARAGKAARDGRGCTVGRDVRAHAWKAA